MIHVSNGRVTENWIGVFFERAGPLRGVLGVFPACLVRFDVALCALPEAHGASRLSGLAGACVGASGQGVDPITRGLEHDRRPLAGILERQADELKAPYAPWLSLEVSDQEVAQAISFQARQFPGQEKKIFEMYQRNPAMVANVRAPLYEEKVVDYVMELVSVTNENVSRETLFAEDDAPPALADKQKAKPAKTAKAEENNPA